MVMSDVNRRGRVCGNPVLYLGLFCKCEIISKSSSYEKGEGIKGRKGRDIMRGRG